LQAKGQLIWSSAVLQSRDEHVGAVSASVRHATVAPAPWANRPNTAITTLANARPALVVAASTPRRRGAPTFPRPILRDEPHCVGHGCAACPSMTHAVAVLTRTLTLPRYTGVTLLYTRVRQPDAHDDTKRWAAAHHSACNQQAATAASVLVVVTAVTALREVSRLGSEGWYHRHV
jgi:hypothetical protein